MKPEEKAEELMNKIGEAQYSDPVAKQIFISTPKIALICVDEIIKDRANDFNDPDITTDQIEANGLLVNYWKSVREAIEAMK